MLLFLVGCSNGASETNEVDSITHIHDMAFDRESDGELFIGTHHGLLKIDVHTNEMQWQGTADDHHDFMGFSITADNVFLTSGHPHDLEKFKDPLGFMVSEDQGETWDFKSLYGEVDFHLIEVNEGNSDFIYGFDAYNQQLSVSTDGGEKWNIASANGIEGRFNELYTITSDPNNPEIILAGMGDGIYQSDDQGESFTLLNNELTMTSVSQRSDGTLLAHGIGRIEGLIVSEDNGETWEPIGELPTDDPVMAMTVDHQHEERIVIGTASDSVYMSEDLGETWTTLVEDGKPI